MWIKGHNYKKCLKSYLSPQVRPCDGEILIISHRLRPIKIKANPDDELTAAQVTDFV